LRPALVVRRYQPSLATHTSSFASFAGQIDMTTANAWAAHSAQSPFAHFSFQRRALEPQDVRIDILRSEEHTSELQSLMRISYAVFCLKKKTTTTRKKTR